jgi:hypothetical protein
MRYYYRTLRCFHEAKRLARVPTRLTISHETAGAILLSLANETKRPYIFVREFLTKLWFCDAVLKTFKDESFRRVRAPAPARTRRWPSSRSCLCLNRRTRHSGAWTDSRPFSSPQAEILSRAGTMRGGCSLIRLRGYPVEIMLGYGRED